MNMKEQEKSVYYLVGRGKGALSSSDWNEKDAKEHLTMQCQSIGNADVYSITVTLCAGDAFQICHAGSWDGQVGIGFMEGVAFCDGINPHDDCHYLIKDQMLACVKNNDGDTVFFGYNEFYRSYKTWNITVGEGMDGEYRLIYISYPSTPSFNRLLWEKLA